MLKIRIEKKNKDGEYQLKMKGHCNFALEGKDIVCAAASILCLSMAQVIENNKDKLLKKPQVIKHRGHATIRWKPKPEFEGALNNSLYTVEQGLKILEHEYPDYIRIER